MHGNCLIVSVSDQDSVGVGAVQNVQNGVSVLVIVRVTYAVLTGSRKRLRRTETGYHKHARQHTKGCAKKAFHNPSCRLTSDSVCYGWPKVNQNQGRLWLQSCKFSVEVRMT